MKHREGGVFLLISGQNRVFLHHIFIGGSCIKKQQFVHSDMKLKEMAARSELISDAKTFTMNLSEFPLAFRRSKMRKQGKKWAAFLLCCLLLPVTAGQSGNDGDRNCRLSAMDRKRSCRRLAP